MSDKKYHDGGYVTGEPLHILPVGDCHQFSEFAKELMDKVRSVTGVSSANFCVSHSNNAWIEQERQMAKKFSDVVFRQWFRENAICFPTPSDDESV